MNHPSEEFPVNLVCSSLRQRPAWSSTATQLLQSDGRRWREAHLGTHDIALTIPDPHTEENHDTFRLLLLSPEDLTNPRTLPRIQHLHRLSNGRNTALLFFLESQNGAQPAMQPFMDLHITLHSHNCPMPIIPLASSSAETDNSHASPAAAGRALQTFRSSLVASRGAARRRWPVDTAGDLLPYCTTTATTTTTNNNNETGSSSSSSTSVPAAGLSRRAVEVLSGRWFSFGELLRDGVATEEGRREVREAVGDAEGEGVVAFWGFEFATAG
ncbi:hypothetical protein C8A01DRAFT_47707 [Parachaetomium inaequale]|uniref:Uncharacterized protein n=1 Tax=Parachaetomium inaequale TaxID=2588326 RepID=A0AAN6PDS7_9PEZI|nr:hypothetical protein C8A01DRAFT_47707 [Parachaetomium inaequale]